MYVPWVYPVYSEFPLPLDNDSEHVSTVQNEGLDQPLPLTKEDTQDASAESPSVDSMGTGLRYPRYSRRLQSKSEPSSSGTTSEEA